MTCHFGEGVVICDGLSGWRVELDVECPWCKEKQRCISSPVFGGWCGSDYICGGCGYKWGSDDGGWRKLTNDEFEENKARVAAFPDPKCWECHDTGDLNDYRYHVGEMDEEPRPCACKSEAAK